MSRYRMEDGTVVNTDLARAFWDEDMTWDNRNYISVPTGSQWEHEKLYLSKKGRYYLESWSDWQGSIPSASYVDSKEAVAWLVLNSHKVPSDLTKESEEVTE